MTTLRLDREQTYVTFVAQLVLLIPCASLGIPAFGMDVEKCFVEMGIIRATHEEYNLSRFILTCFCQLILCSNIAHAKLPVLLRLPKLPRRTMSFLSKANLLHAFLLCLFTNGLLCENPTDLFRGSRQGHIHILQYECVHDDEHVPRGRTSGGNPPGGCRRLAGSAGLAGRAE